MILSLIKHGQTPPCGGVALRSGLLMVLLFWGASAVAEEQSFDLFPTGKPWMDVRIPRYNESDVLTSMMYTESLTRRDVKELKLEGLTVVMFQSSGKMSLRLKTKEGLYDVATSLLRTHSTTYIEHPQFDMKGDRMKFDTASQTGTLEGNVEMLIYNIPVSVPTPAPAPRAISPVPEKKGKPEPAKSEGNRPVELVQNDSRSSPLSQP